MIATVRSIAGHRRDEGMSNEEEVRFPLLI
jgi:hypothetical protein